MGRRAWNKIGVLLIILSFICMGSGLVVAYHEGDFVFSGSSSVLGHNEGNDINISTVDGQGPEGLSSGADSNQGSTNSTDSTNDNSNKGNDVDNNSTQNDNSSNAPVSPSTTQTPNVDNNTNGSNGNNFSDNSSENETGDSVENSQPPSTESGDTTTTTPVPTPEPEVTPEPEITPEVVTPTIEETNNTLRNNIQNQYGITVKYGSETAGYSVGGMSTVQISDANVVKKALEDMQSTISLFPVGIWNEMKTSGYPLTIYLINNYSSANVTGVTESFSNRVTISIATKFSFGETFNHEVFHYLENFMKQFRGANFNNWTSFNPVNFTYGSVNSSLSYSRTLSGDAYFVNDYAQTQDAEDRASTFEYMMFTSKAACLNNGKPVWQKAKYMAEQLDNYFNSVSPNVIEHWERHL